MGTTNLSVYDKNTLPNAENYTFGIIVSKWNSEITEGLLKGALDTLNDLGVDPSNIHIKRTPGSYELIFASNQLAKSEKYDAVISIGSVIRGETAHFDYVCDAVAQGIKDININTNTPTIFCVLTDDTLQQAQDRSGGKYGNKGVEAAVTAVEMIDFKKNPHS